MYHDQLRLTAITFVAFDTETTGLFPIMHRLVEIGAVRFRLDGRDHATFQQLIDPEIPIPQDVQQMYGITDRMVRGQPTLEQVIPQFIEFLGHRDTILLAHNAPFDLGFLAMSLIRLGIAYPPHYLLDMLELARRLYPTWQNHSLEHVAIKLNVANKAEHRAMSDARAVKDIFLAMLQHAPTVKTIADVMRLSPLLTFADAPVFAIHPKSSWEVRQGA
jgi:DNA polymerase III epsilon subunit family exonuclease